MPLWLNISIQAVTLLIAVWAFFVSREASKKANEVADLQLSKASQERDEELSRLISGTAEVHKRVTILDDWIFTARVFTRKRGILEALDHLCYYWKENDERLRRMLGADSRPYRGLKAYYHAALDNSARHNLPGGSAPWIGIGDAQMGYKLDTLFLEIGTTLERVRDSARR